MWKIYLKILLIFFWCFIFQWKKSLTHELKLTNPPSTLLVRLIPLAIRIRHFQAAQSDAITDNNEKPFVFALFTSTYRWYL